MLLACDPRILTGRKLPRRQPLHGRVLGREHVSSGVSHLHHLCLLGGCVHALHVGGAHIVPGMGDAVPLDDALLGSGYTGRHHAVLLGGGGARGAVGETAEHRAGGLAVLEGLIFLQTGSQILQDSQGQKSSRDRNLRNQSATCKRVRSL